MSRDIEALPFLRAVVTAAKDETLSDGIVRDLLLEAEIRVMGMEGKKKDDPSNVVAKLSYSKVDGEYHVERYK
jgi:hypothetical protein